MLRFLEDDDVEVMLESTFAIIIQHWRSFDKRTRAQVEETLQYIIKERARLIRIHISTLPALSSLPELEKIESKLRDMRKPTDVGNSYQLFARRIKHENSGVVLQALFELKAFLEHNQAYLQSNAVSEQPDTVLAILVRAILDACVRLNGSHQEIARLAAECLGMIGCLDPNRIELVRQQSEMIMISNFDDPEETVDFVTFLLREVIVKAFLSATDTSVQGFLSFVMQELLERTQFTKILVPILREGKKTQSHDNAIHKKWLSLPESVQVALTPFLTSRYALVDRAKQRTTYPIFPPNIVGPGKAYNKWLRTFVFDLLLKPHNSNADIIFAPLSRGVRIKDLSVASALLPYVVLHSVVLGSEEDRNNISTELNAVLDYKVTEGGQIKAEDAQFCIEVSMQSNLLTYTDLVQAVFRILDYMSLWIQAKQLSYTQNRVTPSPNHDLEIARVEHVLKDINAEKIADRALECKAYSRALLSWEQRIRIDRLASPQAGLSNDSLGHLQYIYTQIDEPDGIEGISAHMHVLDIDQQSLAHRKAGRWTAAQTWYEIQLAENPNSATVQIDLMTCLKESGQYG